MLRPSHGQSAQTGPARGVAVYRTRRRSPSRLEKNDNVSEYDVVAGIVAYHRGSLASHARQGTTYAVRSIEPFGRQLAANGHFDHAAGQSSGQRA